MHGHDFVPLFFFLPASVLSFSVCRCLLPLRLRSGQDIKKETFTMTSATIKVSLSHLIRMLSHRLTVSSPPFGVSLLPFY